MPLMVLVLELLVMRVRLLGLEIAPEENSPVPVLMIKLVLYCGATAINPEDPAPPVATALPLPEEPPPPPDP